MQCGFRWISGRIKRRALQILCLVAGLHLGLLWLRPRLQVQLGRGHPRPSPSPRPSHPSRNTTGHDGTWPEETGLWKLDSRAQVNGGGGCIERLGSLWSLRGAAVEPCPAWVEGVQQRRLRRHGGQLSAHTPTDHRRGSLCPQVAAWQYKHGNQFSKLLILPSGLYLSIGFHGNCVPSFPFSSTPLGIEQKKINSKQTVEKSEIHSQCL